MRTSIGEASDLISTPSRSTTFFETAWPSTVMTRSLVETFLGGRSIIDNVAERIVSLPGDNSKRSGNSSLVQKRIFWLLFFAEISFPGMVQRIFCQSIAVESIASCPATSRIDRKSVVLGKRGGL